MAQFNNPFATFAPQTVGIPTKQASYVGTEVPVTTPAPGGRVNSGGASRQSSSIGGGGGGMAPAAPVAPPAPSQDDFLNSDATYLAALSNYGKTYDDLLADVTRRQNDYTTDYNKSISRLGAIVPTDANAPVSFDWGNQQTAAGQAYQSLIQDFAARGLLNSGDYVKSQGDLLGRLTDQYTDSNNSKQNFLEGLNSERRAGDTAKTGGIAQARAEALARYAAQYGQVV